MDVAIPGFGPPRKQIEARHWDVVKDMVVWNLDKKWREAPDESSLGVNDGHMFVRSHEWTL